MIVEFISETKRTAFIGKTQIFNSILELNTIFFLKKKKGQIFVENELQNLIFPINLCIVIKKCQKML